MPTDICTDRGCLSQTNQYKMGLILKLFLQDLLKEVLTGRIRGRSDISHVVGGHRLPEK